MRKEDFLCTGEFLTGGPKGESWAKQGPRGQKTEQDALLSP